MNITLASFVVTFLAAKTLLLWGEVCWQRYLTQPGLWLPIKHTRCFSVSCCSEPRNFTGTRWHHLHTLWDTLACWLAGWWKQVSVYFAESKWHLIELSGAVLLLKVSVVNIHHKKLCWSHQNTLPAPTPIYKFNLRMCIVLLCIYPDIQLGGHGVMGYIYTVVKDTMEIFTNKTLSLRFQQERVSVTFSTAK